MAANPSHAADEAGFLKAARCPVQFVGDWQAVLAKDTVEVVASGFKWTEGPVWVEDEAALYFTDTIAAIIYRLKDGVVAPHVLDAGGYDGSNCDNYADLAEPGSNGMALDTANPGVYAMVCQHATARVVR